MLTCLNLNNRVRKNENAMEIVIDDFKQIGAVSKLVRQSQGLNQDVAAMYSNNGITFMSEFENGKPTVELHRVFSVLEALGVKVTLNLPLDESALTGKQKKHLSALLVEFKD